MHRPTTRPVTLALSALLALSLGACGKDDTAAPTGDTATDAADVDRAPPDAPVEDELLWYDEHERAAAGEGVVWVAAWFAPEALEDPTVADMEIRFRKAPELTPEASMLDMARVAFAALEGEGPVDLLNPLEGIPMRLLGAKVEDRSGVATAVLDFGEGLPLSNGLGSAGGQAAEAQFHAMVAEYFPDATQVVVTIEGNPAGELFHGKSYDGPVTLAR